MGIFDLFVLQVVYPLMKRVTYWPQAFLGRNVEVLSPLSISEVPLMPGLAMGWGYVFIWVMRVKLQDLGIPLTYLLGTVWY